MKITLTGLEIVEDGRLPCAIAKDRAALIGARSVTSGRVEEVDYDPRFDVLTFEAYFDSRAWTGL